MDIFKLIGIGLAGAISALVLKEYKPSLALSLAFITAAILFCAIGSELGYVFDLVRMLSDYLSVDSAHIGTVLRIVGIAYVSHFGSTLCADAGQKLVAEAIEFCGRVTIIITGIPILTAVLNLLMGIL